MFKKERDILAKATETAKQSINTSLVVAGIAIVISVIALIVGILK